VRAPDDAGAYELRYVSGQSRKTVAKLPITVAAVTASLEAPPSASAGAKIEVAWTGPDNKNDYITIVAVGTKEGKSGNYNYTRRGSPLEIKVPGEAGAYELRYVTGQSRRTLARLPITVR
jgi:Ca-activated chloride channel family protein